MRQGTRAAVAAMGSLVLLAAAAGAQGPAAGPRGGAVPALLTSSGSVLVRDGTLIPPYPRPGRWIEQERKADGHREVRRFRYFSPGAPPAMELYVTADRMDEPHDGVFEEGLVKGCISGFAQEGEMSSGRVFFEDRRIGMAPVRTTKVLLLSDKRSFRLYAWIFPRRPSLVFLTIRPAEGDEGEMEAYLASLGIGAR